MKAPPFARELVAARRRGEPINLHVFAGDHSWRRAQSRRPPHVLCLPPGDDPKQYDWKCAAGLSVTIAAWNLPPDQVEELARELIHAGAQLVVALAGLHDGHRVFDCTTSFYAPRAAA